MNSHTIIEFSTNGDYRLGVVTGELGKKKLLVVTEHGDEMRPSHDDVAFEAGRLAGDAPSTDNIVEHLRGLRAEISAYSNDVDLEILWEVASDLGEPLTPEQLAELMFATQEPVAILALLQVLRSDHVYFKCKRQLYEARTSSQVEDLKEQRAAIRRKQESRGTFITALKEILKTPVSQRKEVLTHHQTSDEKFVNYLQLLQDYAVFGDEFDRIHQAEDLLDEADEALKLRLKGRAQMRAFHLLVELGLWHHHENLWLHRYRIPTQAPPELLDIAGKYASKPWEAEPWRKDLSDLLCITIDDASTRDIDDALSCVPHIDGSWEVGIHIADPSAIVSTSCALDAAAQKRGTSLYLPTGTIPMFPGELSEGKMSLVEGELRPAISTIIKFDADLNIVNHEVFPSAICVDKRLSYNEADHLLERSDQERLANLLHALSYIADESMNRRMDNGAISIDLPEVKLKVDLSTPEPVVSCETVDNESPSRFIVSEMMVLANQLIAEFCAEHQIPTLYRAQDPPDSDLFDDTIMDLPDGVVRSFAMVRKMKRSDFTTIPAAHFGLGVQTYVQASSPIRRYGDLICQRQLKAFLSETALPYNEQQLVEILGAVESTTRDAIRVERETKRYWLLYFLHAHRHSPLEAIVVEHKDSQGLRAGVFLPLCALKANCQLQKPLPLGSSVPVRVERADPRKDILVLREA